MLLDLSPILSCGYVNLISVLKTGLFHEYGKGGKEKMRNGMIASEI